MASPRSAGGSGAFAGDEAIWRKLREAGFDEDAVRRRDKAALIGYISQLESEIYEYQHNLGLVLLDQKELASKYEQLKASSEVSETMIKRERACHQSALAEARKREGSLKRNLAIKHKCVSDLENALHNIRKETAEVKVSSEAKLDEARQMMETAQKKFDQAEEKLLAAKSLEAECIRTRNASQRRLQDIEDREDQLRRYQSNFELENASKEKEINLLRKSLDDTQRILHEKEQSLLKQQLLLNQRDDTILERLGYITQSEKRLEEEKLNLEDERKVLLEEKNKLDLNMQEIICREEVIIEKESILNKRESELLVLQENIASKERAEIERLRQNHDNAMARRRQELDTEMDIKRASFEEEIGARKALLDQRETAINEQEDAVSHREQNLNIRLAELANKEEALVKKSDELREEEKRLSSERELLDIQLQKEKEAIRNMKLDLEKEKTFFEEEKREAIQAQENLAITQNEREDLQSLQVKLKDEIDSLRAQKVELMVDAERLLAEKERFEIEWELIDEKKEELQKEAARIAEERRVMDEHLKSELEIIKQEKESLRVQFKGSAESLAREHDEFMNKMQKEHASWLSRIQREREDLKKDIDIQRKELLNSAKARQMEMDSYLREKEEEFEQKKSKELEYINSEKETISSKLEYVRLELQKLEEERKGAMLERERREQELSEIKDTIDALNEQREKLQEQRKLLHSDRESITLQIRQLNELEELKIESENKQLSLRQCGKLKNGGVENLKENGAHMSPDEDKNASPEHTIVKKLELSPVSTPISWVRKCAQVFIFKRSPDKSADAHSDRLVPAKLANDIDTSLAAAYSDGLFAHQLENGAGKVPQTVDGLKVGKKRFNNALSHCDSEILEPKLKQRRSTTQTLRGIGGENDSNCPSVLEEKCSKNEHDAVPVGLCGKGPHNTQAELASSDDVLLVNGKSDASDVPEGDEHSEDISMSAAKPSKGHDFVDSEDKDEPDEESDDEGEEEDKTSSAKKIWRFLIT